MDIRAECISVRGIIHEAIWKAVVDLFKGDITMDDMAAGIVDGRHPNIIDRLEQVTSHHTQKAISLSLSNKCKRCRDGSSPYPSEKGLQLTT